MGTFVIDRARLVFPGERIQDGSLAVQDTRIAAVGPSGSLAGDARIDAGGALLTPGLIDLHVHGMERFSFDSGPEAILAASARLGRYGTTGFFPTLVPRLSRDMLDRLRAAAEALPAVVDAYAPGLHLEGPFTAIPGAGCDVVPGDLRLLDEILDACRGRLAIMSLSPDTPGIVPVIERLREAGVVAFVTHTRADVVQAQRAMDAGALHATHLYDVFPALPERDPGVRCAGVVEAYLADRRATVDFIADGVHVDPVVIRLAVRAKGACGVALITDANVGAGLPPGRYPTPWGYAVQVEDGRGARVADAFHPLHGSLAGSALTMNRGIANLLGWLDLPAEAVWAMGTSTPARIAGLAGVGTLAVGARADLCLWRGDLTPSRTWVAGRELAHGGP